MLFASGIPFDVQESTDSQNTDGQLGAPVARSRGRKLTVPNRSKNQWFNTDAFAPSTYVLWQLSAQSVEPGRAPRS